MSYTPDPDRYQQLVVGGATGTPRVQTVPVAPVLENWCNQRFKLMCCNIHSATDPSNTTATMDMTDSLQCAPAGRGDECWRRSVAVPMQAGCRFAKRDLPHQIAVD